MVFDIGSSEINQQLFMRDGWFMKVPHGVDGVWMKKCGRLCGECCSTNHFYIVAGKIYAAEVKDGKITLPGSYYKRGGIEGISLNPMHICSCFYWTSFGAIL